MHKDELLGLVVPQRTKRETDLDVEIVSTTSEQAFAPAKPRSVVQTVRRADVAKSVVVPEVAKGSDVAIPVATAQTAADDPFVDLFSAPTTVKPIDREELLASEAVPPVVPTELPPISIKLPSPLTRVRQPKRRFAPSLVQQIAIGVVLGCVGLGVYLGIAAT